MRLLFLKIFLLTLLVAVSGCTSANRYGVTYQTKPEGASIICDGQDRGYSPVDLEYKLDEEHKSNGILYTRQCTAIWKSGYSSNFDTAINLNEFPNGLITTITRASGKGYKKDIEFASRIQQIRAVSDSGIGIPVEYENYLNTGENAPLLNPIWQENNNFISVQPNLFYDVESSAYTTSPDPHVAPHVDPHVLPHLVPHVAPHWEPHSLPHLLPHLQ